MHRLSKSALPTLAVFALCGLAPIAGHADQAKVTYRGTVGEVRYADCNAYRTTGSCSSWTFSQLQSTDAFVGTSIALGDAFTGSFTVDPAARGYLSADGYQTSYLYATKSSTFNTDKFALPRPQIGTSDGHVSVVDGRNGADLVLISHYYTNSDVFVILSTSSYDGSGKVFNSQAFPATLDGSMFPSNRFSLTFLRRSDGDQIAIEGTLTSFALAPVPEPGTLGLLTAGLMALGLLSRTRRSLHGRH